ncbi:KH domain-containing protein [Spironucleus salmonicida]|uniref:KH domain-containing protein n=1 Tax=Spironucleus salmonicida TaxID=348837 RepID=V6LRW2_9EUKA|nr:KH domain-containing protein [Spironucleus salmonicida]|eukprot:EST46431.1 KH domain-containing protein [Spironucleus salmonicida]
MNFLEIATDLLNKYDKNIMQTVTQISLTTKPENVSNFTISNHQPPYLESPNKLILQKQSKAFITAILGPRGSTLQAIQSQLNCTITIRNDIVTVYGTDFSVYLTSLVFADFNEKLGQNDNDNAYKQLQFKQMKQKQPTSDDLKKFKFKNQLPTEKMVIDWIQSQKDRQNREHCQALDFYYDCLNIAKIDDSVKVEPVQKLEKNRIVVQIQQSNIEESSSLSIPGL